MAPRPSRVRVCHLGKYYPPARGGIETHVQTIARAQAELGAEVQVICVNHADSTGQDVTWNRLAATPSVEERDDAVRVIRLGRRANAARLDLCPGLPRALLRLAHSAVDIVHLHLPNPTMMLPLAVLPLRAPLLVTHHSDIVRQRLLRHVVRPIERRVFGVAARVLATTPVYAERSPLLREFADKVDVLPLGIDLRPFRAPSAEAMRLRLDLIARHSAPLWLTVGRLVYYKGLDVALQALQRVEGTLLIAGTGPMEAELRARANALGVSGRVVWLGEVSDDQLVAAYHAATALWFPSNAASEAFGLVQVEAMAAGCPVVNCRIAGSGSSWVALDGECALTVPPNDHIAFADAARRLVADPSLRLRLSEGARTRAMGFDREAMASRSLEIYARVLERRP